MKKNLTSSQTTKIKTKMNSKKQILNYDQVKKKKKDESKFN